MKDNYRSFQRLIERFYKEIQQMKKDHPIQYLAISALSTPDSEWEPDVTTGDIKEDHKKIVIEFFFRSHRN